MGKLVQNQYDAFISYRHAELDSFVAETLQKELESFKLPRKIIKQRNDGEKTRITRVFRDSTELPLATNLSEPITEALGCSEFLIIICTPRLKDSIWCQKEIETFIALHGRERILAILAEGEPSESFPEQICKVQRIGTKPDGSKYSYYEAVEPLAADVRAADRRTIKKKIKEEIIRVASPIFGVAYDDLKQRHREQKIKKVVGYTMAIAAAFFLFGISSMYQYFKIKNQEKVIQEQYDSIQEEYKKNLSYQADIILDSVEEKMKDGLYTRAMNQLAQSLPEDINNTEYTVNYRTTYVLANLLKVYDSGHKLSPYADADLDMAASYADNLTGNKIFFFDGNSKLTFWDVEKNEEINSYNAKTYIWDKSNYVIGSDGSLVVRDCEKLICFDPEKYEVKWEQDISDAASIDINRDDNTVLCSNDDSIFEYDINCGDCIREYKLPDEVIQDYYIFKLAYSKKDSTIAIVCKPYKENYFEDFGEISSIDYKIVSVDYKTFDKKSEGYSTFSSIYQILFDDEDDSIIICGSYESAGDDTFNIGGKICKMKTSEDGVLDTVWEKITHDVANEISLGKSKELLILSYDKVVFCNSMTGEDIDSTSFNAAIENYYLTADLQYVILLNNGEYNIQEIGTYDFIYADGIFGIHSDYVEEYLLTPDFYVTFEMNKSNMVVYDLKMAAGYEKVENEDSIVYMEYQDITSDERRDFEKRVKISSENQIYAYADLGETYYALITSDYTYIIRKSDDAIVAQINDLIAFDEEKNLIYIYTDAMYQIPLYSLEELLEIQNQ